MFALSASAKAPAPKTEPYPAVSEVYVPHIPKKQAPSTYCSCVNYAKAYLGKAGEIWGNAWNIKPTHSVPQIGNLILLTDGRGHVGVVVSVDAETVTFTEANYIPCQKTVRLLDLDSSTIRGYKSVL